MASAPFFLDNAITYYACLVFLVSFIPNSFSQIAGNSPPVPTVSDCGPLFLPLASCAPFVQGAVPFPVQQCCDNVKQLYQQQPACICLLLNGSTLRSFPINSTRALELPGFCSLQINIATCGVSQQVPPSSQSPPLPPSPPPSHVSFGTNSSSAVAGSKDWQMP
ncbi:hypothetical protein Leryth_006126 [Lithospermum erythrorhizon]|nr:hypothetical protein Leryth_006126 [Lithospermum erythrorhizon]